MKTALSECDDSPRRWRETDYDDTLRRKHYAIARAKKSFIVRLRKRLLDYL